MSNEVAPGEEFGYLEIGRAHGGGIGNSEREAYRIENVGFPGTVEAGDRVEALVPAQAVSTL